MPSTLTDATVVTFDPYSDCTIRHGSIEYRCHRGLLSRIPYFSSMLSLVREDDNQRTLDLTNVFDKSNALTLVLQYLYEGKLNHSELRQHHIEDLADLWLLAEFLMYDQLKLSLPRLIAETLFIKDELDDNLTSKKTFELYSSLNDDPVFKQLGDIIEHSINYNFFRVPLAVDIGSAPFHLMLKIAKSTPPKEIPTDIDIPELNKYDLCIYLRTAFNIEHFIQVVQKFCNNDLSVLTDEQTSTIQEHFRRHFPLYDFGVDFALYHILNLRRFEILMVLIQPQLTTEIPYACAVTWCISDSDNASTDPPPIPVRYFRSATTVPSTQYLKPSIILRSLKRESDIEISSLCCLTKISLRMIVRTKYKIRIVTVHADDNFTAITKIPVDPLELSDDIFFTVEASSKE
ncbi:hypothetical protein BKA69DRAFT_1039262 [Paraphysoderma sedebokerense]|nr:hypothetical protein BKA69DRAFT_1128087 [Paraphysoderma sedebokerense]KAI9140569.1 hypothetical protein BKA69DRAFT_1125646 [Paraphysoderma sedebokerense]KAI9140576.1 hypothetical protein BKA69DRAFT_1039262 [Paraphysoderma sedebokerense]